MSIQVLTDLHREVRRLFIAGSGLAAGDLRLAKLVPQLRHLSGTAPVLGKVADAVSQLCEADRERAPGKLLELGALLHAILYTQGDADTKGEFREFEPYEPLGGDAGSGAFALATPATFRQLKPLIDALTERGSGRLEVIRQACEAGLFADMRTHVPAVIALEDPSSEIAEFVSVHVIPAIGTPALPILDNRLELEGGRGDARKLQLIHRLTNAGAEELVVRAAREGSQEVRIAAIELLADYPGQEAYILEQSRDKKKEVRRAALHALAGLGTGDAAARLLEALRSKDQDIAVEPVRLCGNERLTAEVIGYAEALSLQLRSEGQVDASADKAAKEKAAAAAAEKLHYALQALDGKREPAVAAFLMNLVPDTTLPAKEAANLREQAAGLLLDMETSGTDLFLHDLRDRRDLRLLSYSFRAAMRVLTAAEWYDAYEPFVRNRKQAEAKELLGVMRNTALRFDILEDGSEEREHPLMEWDGRWIYRFVELDETELVCRLVQGPDDKVEAYLLGKFAAEPKLAKHGTAHLLLALFRLGHAEAAELTMKAFEAMTSRQLYYLDREKAALLLQLPRTYVDRLRTYAEGLAYEGVKNEMLEIAELIGAKPEQPEQTTKGAGWIEWIKRKMY
ncbi:HEAT repeat domain-containing protein [Paenibacillus sp. GYB004]|uniref:HEAT repeat domain-containing protein n=1 Tax=Paenibacillus sp. GYB004 TaxID=2994393 RepID=UPI002F9613B0